MQSAALDQLAAALARAQGALRPASKDAINPHFKSRYADLGACWDACRAALAENELAVIQATATGEDGWPFLRTIIVHSSGQFVAGHYPIRPVKDDPQALGSAVTYSRRYALCAMVGVVSDDDDGQAGSGPAPAARRPDARPAPRPAPRPKAKPAGVARAEAEHAAAERAFADLFETYKSFRDSLPELERPGLKSKWGRAIEEAAITDRQTMTAAQVEQVRSAMQFPTETR